MSARPSILDAVSYALNLGQRQIQNLRADCLSPACANWIPPYAKFPLWEHDQRRCGSRRAHYQCVDWPQAGVGSHQRCLLRVPNGFGQRIHFVAETVIFPAASKYSSHRTCSASRSCWRILSIRLRPSALRPAPTPEHGDRWFRIIFQRIVYLANVRKKLSFSCAVRGQVQKQRCGCAGIQPRKRADEQRLHLIVSVTLYVSMQNLVDGR